MCTDDWDVIEFSSAPVFCPSSLFLFRVQQAQRARNDVTAIILANQTLIQTSTEEFSDRSDRSFSPFGSNIGAITALSDFFHCFATDCCDLNQQSDFFDSYKKTGAQTKPELMLDFWIPLCVSHFRKVEPQLLKHTWRNRYHVSRVCAQLSVGPQIFGKFHKIGEFHFDTHCFIVFLL